jgi:hypothetical protein
MLILYLTISSCQLFSLGSKAHSYIIAFKLLNERYETKQINSYLDFDVLIPITTKV